MTPESHSPAADILIASDLQATSRTLIALARSLAEAGGSVVHLVHVVEAKGWGDRGAARELEEQATADAARGLEVQAASLRELRIEVGEVRVLREPSTHEAILKSANRTGAGLLIVGSHVRGGPGRRLGSTADRLIRTAPIPILVARGQAWPELRKVALLYDGSPASKKAMRSAAHLLARFTRADERPKIDLLTVADRAYWFREEDEEYLRSAAMKALTPALADGFGGDAPGARALVRWGAQPLDAILEEAEAEGYDLIVAGTHGKGPIVRWLVGSVALGLAQSAPCPVLVVPVTEE